MITLYTFGPAFGLPDPSPFVMKAQMLLKLAKLEYQANTKGFFRAPKGKLPFIDDNGTIVADSTLIRLHLEQKHGDRLRSRSFDARPRHRLGDGKDARGSSLLGAGVLALDERRQLRTRPGELLQARAGASSGRWSNGKCAAMCAARCMRMASAVTTRPR